MATATPGSWTSPLTADLLVASATEPRFTQWFGEELFWDEKRPDEGGRNVVVSRDRGNVLPAPWSAATRVNEMGGLSWLVTHWCGEPGVIFVNASDQCIYWRAFNRDPVAITSELAEGLQARYCDFLIRGDELWCIREIVSGHEVSRDIIAVTREGKIRTLDNSSHFYAHLQLAPSQNRLAWIAWEHPQMPWDETELKTADVDVEGALKNVRVVAGSTEEAVNSPVWSDDDLLFYLSDASGWWNVWSVNTSGVRSHVAPDESEWAYPMWLVGFHWLRMMSDGNVVGIHGPVEHPRVAIVNPQTGQWSDFENDMTFWYPVSVAGSKVAGCAAGPRQLLSVIELDCNNLAALEVVKHSPMPVPAEYFAIPQAVTMPSKDNRVVHGFLYPATNPDYETTELPPVIVFAHGGPTGNVYGIATTEVAWFTSRGFSVIDVNYGGSSGYGRVYRKLLDGQWGVVDTEDIIAMVEGLVSQGLVHKDRVLIRGGSAGGFAVLNALVHSNLFAAGADYYGVAELTSLAHDTHDFESRYLDSLVGPYPERIDLYHDRSPLTHVNNLSSPLIFFQGLDDPIVPPSQSEAFRDACIRRGLKHKYFEFEGESHGFKKAETLITCAREEVIFYGEVLGFVPNV